jgi:hypothetical protein
MAENVKSGRFVDRCQADRRDGSRRSDNGELTTTLLDKGTIADLYQHEYPMLGAANAQSYDDFGASAADSKTEAVRFSSTVRRHSQEWDERDRHIVRYAVEQERVRFAN